MEKARVALYGEDRQGLEMIQLKMFLQWWLSHISLLSELIGDSRVKISPVLKLKDWQASRSKISNFKDSANIKNLLSNRQEGLRDFPEDVRLFLQRNKWALWENSQLVHGKSHTKNVTSDLLFFLQFLFILSPYCKYDSQNE